MESYYVASTLTDMIKKIPRSALSLSLLMLELTIERWKLLPFWRENQ